MVPESTLIKFWLRKYTVLFRDALQIKKARSNNWQRAFNHHIERRQERSVWPGFILIPGSGPRNPCYKIEGRRLQLAEELSCPSRSDFRICFIYYLLLYFSLFMFL